jgi:hypothetical protein
MINKLTPAQAYAGYTWCACDKDGVPDDLIGGMSLVAVLLVIAIIAAVAKWLWKQSKKD